MSFRSSQKGAGDATPKSTQKSAAKKKTSRIRKDDSSSDEDGLDLFLSNQRLREEEAEEAAPPTPSDSQTKSSAKKRSVPTPIPPSEDDSRWVRAEVGAFDWTFRRQQQAQSQSNATGCFQFGLKVQARRKTVGDEF